MKLLVLCLLSVSCSCMARMLTPTEKVAKLREVFLQLDKMSKTLQTSQQMIKTPPADIEDCCCLAALQCFRMRFKVHFNTTERSQARLYRDLKHNYTEKAMNFCESRSAEVTCPGCDSHQKENATVFVTRLQFLIQRGIQRLQTK